MTQKEKLIRAKQMAMRIRSIAGRLRYDANDYDVRFPLAHAKELESIADDYLKLK